MLYTALDLYRFFSVQKKWGISCVKEHPPASQGLCSMELADVSFYTSEANKKFKNFITSRHSLETKMNMINISRCR